MREVTGKEADKLTLFMYEELLAFQTAARKTGLTDTDLEDIFYNNSSAMIDAVRKGV
jgi:hypothetical protein